MLVNSVPLSLTIMAGRLSVLPIVYGAIPSCFASVLVGFFVVIVEENSPPTVSSFILPY